MKKFVSLILLFAIIFTFTACTEGTQDNNAENTTVTSSTPTNEEENSSTSSEETDPVITEALNLAKAGKAKEAYTLLYKNKDNSSALEMLKDFKVVYTKSQDVTYTYNDSGNLIKEECGGNETFYEYDENGHLKKSYPLEGDSGYTLFSCDSHGNVVKESRVYVDGTDVYEYTYDNNNNLTKMRKNDSDGDWYEISYFYDDNENIIKTVESDNDGYIESELYEITYDSQNRISKKIGTFPDGDKKHFDYTYDSNGNIATEHQYYDNTDEDDDTYTYSYDENGNLLKIVRRSGSYTGVEEEYSGYIYFYLPKK